MDKLLSWIGALTALYAHYLYQDSKDGAYFMFAAEVIFFAWSLVNGHEGAALFFGLSATFAIKSLK